MTLGHAQAIDSLITALEKFGAEERKIRSQAETTSTQEAADQQEGGGSFETPAVAPAPAHLGSTTTDTPPWAYRTLVRQIVVSHGHDPYVRVLHRLANTISRPAMMLLSQIQKMETTQLKGLT